MQTTSAPKYQVNQAVILADKTGTMRGIIKAVTRRNDADGIAWISYRVEVTGGSRTRTFLRTENDLSPAYVMRNPEETARLAVLRDYRSCRRFESPWSAMRSVQHGIANIMAGYIADGIDGGAIERLTLQWKIAKEYRAQIDALICPDIPVMDRSRQATYWTRGRLYNS